MITPVLAVLLSAATGLASALVPVINAEAYMLLAATRSGPVLAAPIVLATAAGQTAGKIILFLAARKGAEKYADKLEKSKWTARVTGWMASPRTGLPVVFAAASVGLPPLAVVSLAAGAADQDLRAFTLLCFVGRTIRFAVLAAPVVWLV